MNPIFNIDWIALIGWLTPQMLRGAGWLAWVRVQVSQVSFLYQVFLKQRGTNLYNLAITPQVCYLERLLNDRFDYTLRRIHIGDPLYNASWLLYTDDENKPVLLYTDFEDAPKNTYTDQEAGLKTIDFVVFVPAGLIYSDPEMRALLDAHKLAGRTYKIETF